MIQPLLKFLVLNILLYLAGAFVAFDFNPTHWFLFTSVTGRIFLIVLEISGILNCFRDDDI